MPKVIVFDFFNVFCPEMARGWLTTSGAMNPETSDGLSRASVRLDLGQISINDYFEEISRFTGRSEDEVSRGVREQERIDQGVVAIAQALKPTFRIGLASNANNEWIIGVLERNHLTPLFERIIISSAVGIAKPDERFFTYTAAEFAVTPQDILFIDDRKLNTDAAERVGMQTILFTSAEQLKRELLMRNIIKK